MNDFMKNFSEKDKEDYQKFNNGKLNYYQYLKTDHWHKIRKEAVLRVSGRCRLCRKKKLPLNVHHCTYNNLWNEKEYDIIVLCRPCHALNHHKIDPVYNNAIIKVSGIEGEKLVALDQWFAKELAVVIEKGFDISIQAEVVERLVSEIMDNDFLHGKAAEAMGNNFVEFSEEQIEKRRSEDIEDPLGYTTPKGFLLSSLSLIKEHHPDSWVYPSLAKKYRFLDKLGHFSKSNKCK